MEVNIKRGSENIKSDRLIIHTGKGTKFIIEYDELQDRLEILKVDFNDSSISIMPCVSNKIALK